MEQQVGLRRQIGAWHNPGVTAFMPRPLVAFHSFLFVLANHRQQFSRSWPVRFLRWSSPRFVSLSCPVALDVTTGSLPAPATKASMAASSSLAPGGGGVRYTRSSFPSRDTGSGLTSVSRVVGANVTLDSAIATPIDQFPFALQNQAIVGLLAGVADPDFMLCFSSYLIFVSIHRHVHPKSAQIIVLPPYSGRSGQSN